MSRAMISYYGNAGLDAQVLAEYARRFGHPFEFVQEPSQIFSLMDLYRSAVFVLAPSEPPERLLQLAEEICSRENEGDYSVFILTDKPVQADKPAAEILPGKHALRRLVRRIIEPQPLHA